MEHRVTSALYLELVDLAAADYESDRAPKLAANGAHRVSWWENLAPGRDELPMKIPDGGLLGVAEADEMFVPPEPLRNGTAGLFRRYPRPSQGRLTGRPTTGLLIVLISPQRPELTQPLRDWADFVHISHIAAAAVPGFTTVTPYEAVGDAPARFLHCYEMDTDDPEGAYQLMPKLVAERLGGTSTPDFHEWADWRRAGGYLVYCNTFRLIGQR
jgi:hypothetical protein